jgi:two-component system alkaline phosphatase synthesis response regulator PhoP
MSMARILVVEDEPTIAFALEADLTSEGYAVSVAATGPEALRLAGDGAWDLILLDVMLPGKDGFEVCRELRRSGLATPIILLTAKSHEAEKVMGLELGADDYVTKPFSPRELRARIKAALRRKVDQSVDIFRFDNIEVDFARAEVRRKERPVEMSALEFKILTAFVKARRRLLTREQLIDQAWGSGVSLNDRVVDNHIVALRRKLEPDPTRPRFFLNVRGLGYRFDA